MGKNARGGAIFSDRKEQLPDMDRKQFSGNIGDESKDQPNGVFVNLTLCESFDLVLKRPQDFS